MRRRVVGLVGVVAVHALLLVLLTSTGVVPPLLPVAFSARLILQPPLQPQTKPPPIRPALAAPAALSVPLPDIVLATPPAQPAAPRAISRAAPAARPASHFGAAAGDGLGLGLDVATAAGGGESARGTLAGFEAAVRARVLAAKQQPRLAWDRRNTCVVAYRISISASGGLAGYSIDPCGVPEINAAARAALGSAGPFPRPPALGAATTEVHGTLIFHP